MRYKKHMIILLAAIFLFAMATASAADLNDTAVAVEDTQLTDEIIQASENQENTIQASYIDEVNLSEDNPGKLAIGNDKKLGKTVTGHNFDDINRAIESDCTIYLESGTYTGDFQIDIEGKSNIRIIGDSTILDAQGKTQIFNIYQSSNITIQNIIFKNGYTGGYGGAIYVYGNCLDCSISNCTFINNHAGRDGGAIEWATGCNNGRVSNCTFINNHAERNGGAIDWYDSNDGRVNNCTFINNTAEANGDAIYAASCDLNADYNWFGNTADNYNDPLPITWHVKCDYRLFLNVTANPDTITGKDTSNVTFKLYQYGSGVISDYDNAPFKNLDLTITATKGNVKGTAKLDEPIQFTPTGKGTASVTATVENVHQTAEINVLKGDFDLLQDLVNNESLSVINLERNYTYNEFDTITDGVRITRPITINGNGYTIDAKGKSRIFYVTAESINITDVTLKNGKADLGGAIYFENDISNSNINATYTNNTAGQGGANYFNKDVSGSNVSGTYTNNKAEWNGGANNFNLGVSGSNVSGTYTNNKAEWNGGANRFGSVLGSNVCGTYINNTAKSHGGANFFQRSVSSSNVSGTYINNTAEQGSGGANSFGGSVLGLNVCGTYTNNKAEGNGGANYFGSVSGSNVSGTYTNNTAKGHGGANYFGSVLGLNVCGTYTNNKAEGNGGANYFGGSVSGLNVSGTYINNKARYGGANYFGSVSGSNVSGTYINNTAELDGGANYFGSVSGSNVSGTYINNTAERDGGANYFGSVSGSNVSGTYINNTAELDGGANYFGSVSGSNVSGTYINNTAEQNGGANFFQRSVSGSNVSGTYTNNKAEGNGGANCFYSSVSDSNVTGTYTSNKATRDGGANYFRGSVSDSNVTGIYINNTATNGEIIYFEVYNQAILTNVNIENAIFLNNKYDANNGVIYAKKTGVVAKNNWFGNNATNYNTPPKTANIKMDSWLFLNATADPNPISVFDSSDILFKLYSTNGTHISGYDNSKLPVVNLTLTAINGEVSNSTVLDKSVEYMPTKVGQGSVTASVEDAEYTIFLDNNKRDVNLSVAVNPPVIDYGENAAVIFEYNVTATGTVNITLKGKKHNQTIENVALNKTITLPDTILPDEYEVTVSYSGDDVFVNASAASSLTVNQLKSDIKVVGYDIYVNDTIGLLFSVTLPENATGNLTINNIITLNVTKDGRKENISLIIEIMNDAYSVGQYNWTFTYSGDDIYENSEANATANILIIPTEITANATSSLFVDDTGQVTYNVTPENAVGNVKFTSNDTSVVEVNQNGNIKAIAEGTAIITVTFEGCENYTASSANVTVTVSKIATEITLTNATVELKAYGNIGDLATLAPAVAGNLTYASSDEDIVLVSDDGIIYARVKGTATVTVSFAGDNKYKAAENKTITVTVTLNDASVSTENDTIDLYVDDTCIINATANPSFLTVYYTSSNESVATVTEYGNVKAVGEGTAVITLTVGNGETYALNSTNVTVTVSKVPTEIGITNDTLKLEVTDEVSTGATLTPADAGNVTYTISNSSVVKVEDDKIIALAEGETTITVSFAGDKKYAAAENKTISVTVSLKGASVSVNNSTLDLFVDDNFSIVATTVPDGLNVTYVPDNSGVISVDESGEVTALKEGTATITVKVGDGKVYALNSTDVMVTVSKIPTEIIVQNVTVDLKVLDEVAAGVTLTPADAGNVTYTSSNSNVVIVEDGKIKALIEGDAVITVSFAGDKKYAAAENKTISVTVSLKEASVNVNNSTLDLFVDDNFTIVATTVPDGLNVTYVPDNSGIISVDESGEVTALKEGTATITVKVGGDGIYAENSTAISVTVNKQDANVNVSMPANVTVGDNSTVSVKLPSDATGNVTVKVDGEVVDTVAVTDGTADVTIPSLSAGNHTVEIAYSGDGKYNPSNETKEIAVSKKETTPDITIPSDITVGDDSNIEIKLPSDAIGNVTLKVDGEVVDAVPVTDGAANLTIPSLKAGNHTVEISYSGDDKYNSVSETKDITVSKKDATPEVDVDGSNVDVKLPGDATGNVTVKVDDTVVSTVPVTDGTASVKLPKLGAGNHTVEIAYSGDDKYKSASKTAIISVDMDSTSLTADNVTATYKVEKYLTVTLTDSRGSPIANATVSVKLKSLENYTTDENGQVKVKVSSLVPKTYTAKITFKGDDKYAGSNTTAEVTVKKATSKITAKAKTFKTTTKTKKYTVTLKANGKALKNKWVYLKVNGKKYKAKTNSKGKATFKITRLNKAGKFKATVTFKGNDYYKKATKKTTIKVKSVWKTVQKGSKNSAIVKKIQRALKNHGYYLEYNGHYLKVDGIFWDYTEMAVKEFQNDKTLKVTGKVDEKTARKLGII